MNTHWNVFFAVALLCTIGAAAAEPPIATYTVQLDVLTSGYDGKMCWVHPRAGAIAGDPPIVVLTTQKLLLSGSDIFYALHEMRTDDLGKTWSGPTRQDSFARRAEADGTEVVVCDFTPKWHAKSGKLLGTGHLARYKDNHLVREHRRGAAYAVYLPESRSWTPWQTVGLPDLPEFYNSGAGSAQRYDLPGGEILLPVYHREKGSKCYSTSVLRCTFDGETLRYAEHGNSMSVDIERGFCEPSLTKYGERFYLTIRNDKDGYVTSGADGLHFDKPIKWRFDDGEILGNYNTQQHWVTHPKGAPGGLFLVYTRRGANNDHVFRHRAPLFIAQVDPERLCVVRKTERILVPENGARQGNFAVAEVSNAETWVTVSEWMQPEGCEKYGSDNRIYAARIRW